MDYIITKNRQFFEDIGQYNYCDLKDMKLPNRIAIDTETDGLSFLDHSIFCIQIGTGVNNYIIDLQDYTTSIKFKEYENCTQYFREVVPYIENKELVLFNAAFDLGFFYFQGFYPKVIFDCMIASKILHNGEPPNVLHNFGTVMLRELNVKYDKTEQSNIAKVKLSQASTIEYSFNDVDRLLELHENLLIKLEKWKATETYLIHCRFIRAMAYMETCGIPLSSKDWKLKMIEDEKQSKLKSQEVINYIYDNLPKFRNNQISLFETTKKINIQLSSAKQMIPVFKELGINIKNSDDKDSIEEGVINKTKHEFVTLWLEFQKATHRVTTFGEGILKKLINGRVYTRYNPIVDTGRISTRKGEINFLNFPSDEITRSCFKASTGFDMVVSDYDSQENRCTADITQDQAMIEAVVNNSCLHCAFAREIFPELKDFSDSIIKKKYSDKRSAAKAPRFALAYGGNAYTLHINENISMEEAILIENAYRKLHSGIFEWGENELRKVLVNGYIENAAGFKLKLTDFDKFQELDSKIKSFSKDFWANYRIGKEENNLLQEALNKKEKYVIKDKKNYNLYKNNKQDISNYFKLKSQYFRLTLNNPSQGKAAHQTKLAVALLFEYIEKENDYYKARICTSVHDELVMEVTQELSDKYVEKLGFFMRQAGDYFIENKIIKMSADAAKGDSWYSAKKG